MIDFKKSRADLKILFKPATFFHRHFPAFRRNQIRSVVSQHADTVVLSVSRDTSRGPQVLLACEKLAAFGSRKHVVVLSGSHEEVGDEYQDRALNPPVEAVQKAEAAKTEAS